MMSNFNNFLKGFQEIRIKIQKHPAIASFAALIFAYEAIQAVAYFKTLIDIDIKSNYMIILEILWRVLVGISPLVIAWKIIQMSSKVDDQLKSVNENFAQTQENLKEQIKGLEEKIEQKDKENRRKLYQIARLVKVLCAITQHKDDISTEKGKIVYKTPLTVLKGSLSDTELITLIDDPKIDIHNSFVLEEKKIFFCINQNLDILSDTDIRNMFAENYDKRHSLSQR